MTGDQSPLNRTDYHVLLALGEHVRHGYDIIDTFERMTGGTDTILPGTLYSTLGRLLEAGLVEEVEAPPGTSSGGPPRRYYRVTPQGLAAARAESARLRTLLQAAESQNLVPETGS